MNRSAQRPPPRSADITFHRPGAFSQTHTLFGFQGFWYLLVGAFACETRSDQLRRLHTDPTEKSRGTTEPGLRRNFSSQTIVPPPGDPMKNPYTTPGAPGVDFRGKTAGGGDGAAARATLRGAAVWWVLLRCER